MTRFKTAAHLASWCGLCPGNHESAGKRKSGRTRHGNPHLQAALVEAAWVVSHTHTRLGARFRRLHRRFGKTAGKKAAVAVAHTILVTIWHVIADETGYTDLGNDYYTRRDNPEERKNRLLRQLRELGYHADLTPRRLTAPPHRPNPTRPRRGYRPPGWGPSFVTGGGAQQCAPPTRLRANGLDARPVTRRSMRLPFLGPSQSTASRGRVSSFGSAKTCRSRAACSSSTCSYPRRASQCST